MSEPSSLPDRAAVRIFPPAAPLLTIVAGVLLQRVAPLPPGMFARAPFRILGIAIILAAVGFLGAWSVALIRKSGQSENPWKPTTELIIAGPYLISRNPMYLQMIIGCLGFALALANPWILILTPACATLLYLFAIRPEEAYLERKFGAAYRAYKERVRRWI